MSMDWKPLAEEFHRRFRPDPHLEDEMSDDEILIPEEGYTLLEAVRNVVESGGLPEPASDDLSWYLEYRDEESLWRYFHGNLCSGLIEFCWDSGGPMSTFNDLFLWELPGPYYFVSYFRELWDVRPEEPHAAIRKDADEASWDFLLRGFWDGRYLPDAMQRFDSLPSLTTNQRPDLLPDWAVRSLYRDWWEGLGDERCVQIRNRTLRRARGKVVQDLRLPPGIRAVSEEDVGKVIDAYLEREQSRWDQNGTSLTDEERERIFHNFFVVTYRENESTGVSAAEEKPSTSSKEQDERDGESTPFSNDFLEVVQTVHPEIDSRDELLNAAYRMTAIAELATPEEQDEMGPDQGYPIPPMALVELGRMLTEEWRPGLVRTLWDMVEAADPPESDARLLLARLRRWDDDPANRHSPPEMALASFYAQLTAVARADLEGGWWEGNRSE